MERTLLMRPHPRHLSNTLTGTTIEQEVEEGREREREGEGWVGRILYEMRKWECEVVGVKFGSSKKGAGSTK